MLLESVTSLHDKASKIIEVHNDSVTIIDEKSLLEHFIDTLIYTVVFTTDPELRQEAAGSIQKIARARGAMPTSIHSLYRAFGRGEVSGFTIPACNIRTLTYDTARIAFRLAKELNATTFIFEIARSEMKYTFQKPLEYAACILAGAVKENYQGPVFLQGDHFQVNKELFQKDPSAEVANIQDLIIESLGASFYNIDIDASTVVDLAKNDLPEQQRANYQTTAALTAFIREHEPKNITVSIGGEIGHIGGKNSTTSDFEAFMTGYLQRVAGHEGISKVSVQTGTNHGGTPLADGKIADVKLDFSVLESIGNVAREKYHLGGAVQHGASTLPQELFSRFVSAGTLEVHLATGFQNIVFDTMPETLRLTMNTWVTENLGDERKEGMTDQQFIYKLRKKALGPFKKQLWNLDDNEKQTIMKGLEDQLRFLFEAFRIVGTREKAAKYVS